MRVTPTTVHCISMSLWKVSGYWKNWIPEAVACFVWRGYMKVSASFMVNQTPTVRISSRDGVLSGPMWRVHLPVVLKVCAVPTVITVIHENSKELILKEMTFLGAFLLRNYVKKCPSIKGSLTCCSKATCCIKGHHRRPWKRGENKEMK